MFPVRCGAVRCVRCGAVPFKPQVTRVVCVYVGVYVFAARRASQGIAVQFNKYLTTKRAALAETESRIRIDTSCDRTLQVKSGEETTR